MPINHQKITPFQGAQQTEAKEPSEHKVRVMTDGSMHKMGGIKDPLYHALKGIPPNLPAGGSEFIHSRYSKPSGAYYDPTRKFGEIRGHGKPVPAEGFRSHMSRPGSNAVGRNKNRHGDNPLGHAMNRVGTNTAGNNSNRHGDNAVGHYKNRTGEKSGYPHFSPHGGGKNV